MTRKAIFLDIDGTLSVYGGSPCAQDIAALREARAAGHAVLINTGRSRGILPENLVNVDYIDGYLCGCGTQLLLHGEEIFGAVLDRGLLREVAAFYLARPEKACMFEAEVGCYLINNGFEDVPSVPMTRADAFDTLWPEARITKLTITGPFIEEEERLFAGRLNPVIQSSGLWYEAILPGRSKGLGLRRACEMLGIPVADSIAIGDSDNDLEMFSHAGSAVAMANSSPAALRAARYVTGFCGGGVAQAVHALAMGKGRLREIPHG